MAKRKRKPAKHYYLQLYFNEWHQSQPLMLCSMQARGVCIEAEMIMKKSPIPGHLLMANGKPVSIREFACLANGKPEDIEAGLNELLEHGEFEERADGVLFCQRVIDQSTHSKKMSNNALQRYREWLDSNNNGNATDDATAMPE